MMNNRWLDKEKLLKWLDEKADALYFGAVQAKVVEIFREIDLGAFDAPEANQLREENERLKEIDERESLIAISIRKENDQLKADNTALRAALTTIATVDIPFAPMTDHSVMQFYEKTARECLQQIGETDNA